MSVAHLAKGSVEPPRVNGLLRIYSMAYCPFAQRARLVLKAKKIPHDIVNINETNKPEWYFQIHPEGKVPAILEGSKITTESLDISDYLDEKYPENPLYPADPEAKRQDQELIQKIGPVTAVFLQLYTQDKTPAEWVKEFLGPLQVFEDALAQRGTTFFGGTKPGMVDYMLWPWAEREGIIELQLGKKLPIKDDQIPNLCKWSKAMHDDPICAELYNPPETCWKLLQHKFKGTPFDYNNV